MARYLYSALSSLVQARTNCAEDLATLRKSGPNNEGNITSRAEWLDKHEDTANELVKNHMPSGSGFDAGTKLDWERSHADKLVFTTSFHHMNEGGFYDGWTEHTVIVTPSLSSHFHLRITGRNRNDIKELIGDTFHACLMSEVA